MSSHMDDQGSSKAGYVLKYRKLVSCKKGNCQYSAATSEKLFTESTLHIYFLR